jgi:hypothetical protein
MGAQASKREHQQNDKSLQPFHSHQVLSEADKLACRLVPGSRATAFSSGPGQQRFKRRDRATLAGAMLPI